MASTTIAVKATFVVNGKDVEVKSDSIGEGIKFSLDQPIDLGSFVEFTKWLEGTWNVTLPLPSPAAREAWPVGLSTGYKTLSNGEVWIDILDVDTSTGHSKFGVSYRLPVPLDLVVGIKFSKLGLVFTRDWISSKLTEKVTDAVTQLKIPHGEGNKFKQNDTILIDSEYMTVTLIGLAAADKTDSDTLTVDRGQPATQGATASPAKEHEKDAVIWIYNR